MQFLRHFRSTRLQLFILAFLLVAYMFVFRLSNTEPLPTRPMSGDNMFMIDPYMLPIPPDHSILQSSGDALFRCSTCPPIANTKYVITISSVKFNKLSRLIYIFLSWDCGTTGLITKSPLACCWQQACCLLALP